MTEGEVDPICDMRGEVPKIKLVTCKYFLDSPLYGINLIYLFEYSEYKLITSFLAIQSFENWRMPTANVRIDSL